MTVATHWQMAADPFRPATGPFVATPAHEEAVARLLHVIESGERRGVLEAEAGLGKSVVLAEALRRARHPSRRIVLSSAALAGTSLEETLARALTGRAAPARAGAALRDAIRLAARQGLAVVLAIDDAQFIDPRELDRIAALAHGGTRLTILRVGRPGEPQGPGHWDLFVQLPPLSRTEAEHYLAAKLAAAGRDGPTFTARAVARLHALCGGVPRGLDRLAGLALAAGAVRGAEILTAEVVEAVAPECATAVAG
jgi:type II secretory pathway predicted ATPase ExeA